VQISNTVTLLEHFESIHHCSLLVNLYLLTFALEEGKRLLFSIADSIFVCIRFHRLALCQW
jgi:hypothetical protein